MCFAKANRKYYSSKSKLDNEWMMSMRTFLALLVCSALLPIPTWYCGWWRSSEKGHPTQGSIPVLEEAWWRSGVDGSHELPPIGGALGWWWTGDYVTLKDGGAVKTGGGLTKIKWLTFTSKFLTYKDILALGIARVRPWTWNVCSSTESKLKFVAEYPRRIVVVSQTCTWTGRTPAWIAS